MKGTGQFFSLAGHSICMCAVPARRVARHLGAKEDIKGCCGTDHSLWCKCSLQLLVEWRRLHVGGKEDDQRAVKCWQSL